MGVTTKTDNYKAKDFLTKYNRTNWRVGAIFFIYLSFLLLFIWSGVTGRRVNSPAGEKPCRTRSSSVGHVCQSILITSREFYYCDGRVMMCRDVDAVYREYLNKRKPYRITSRQIRQQSPMVNCQDDTDDRQLKIASKWLVERVVQFVKLTEKWGQTKRLGNQTVL